MTESFVMRRKSIKRQSVYWFPTVANRRLPVLRTGICKYLQQYRTVGSDSLYMKEIELPTHEDNTVNCTLMLSVSKHHYICSVNSSNAIRCCILLNQFIFKLGH